MALIYNVFIADNHITKLRAIGKYTETAENFIKYLDSVNIRMHGIIYEIIDFTHKMQ